MILCNIDLIHSNQDAKMHIAKYVNRAADTTIPE